MAEPEDTPGTLVQKARRRKGWSQAALAQRLNLRQATLSEIERDRVVPRTDLALEMQELLGVRVSVWRLSPKARSHEAA